MIIFDTETTGLIESYAIPLKRQPRIIELFALKLNDSLLRDLAREPQVAHSPERLAGWLEELEQGTWHSLFKARINEEIQGITGITPEMVADAPSFAERWESLADFFCGESYLGGHNLPYDRDILAIELRRLAAEFRFPWPRHHVCTVEHTEDRQGFRLGLAQLHEELFGEGFAEAHRAENDVRATARVLVELIRRGDIQL